MFFKDSKPVYKGLFITSKFRVEGKVGVDRNDADLQPLCDIYQKKSETLALSGFLTPPKV